MDLVGGSIPRLQPRADVALEEVGRESAQALAAAMGLPDAAPVLERLQRGSRCFGARIEGELVAYGWASSESECVGELEREFRMGPGEAYVWDCATLPAYRRAGLYTALLSLIARTLCDHDLSRLWIGASLANRPSIRGFVAAGFEPVLRVLYLRLGGLSCLYTAPFRGASSPLVAAARRLMTADDERVWGRLLVSRSRTQGAAVPCGSSRQTSGGGPR